MNDEEKKLLEQLGLSEEELLKEAPAVESKPLHPALKLGLGAAFLFNVGLLLSLPPVLRGRGVFRKTWCLCAKDISHTYSIILYSRLAQVHRIFQPFERTWTPCLGNCEVNQPLSGA